jgi:hypothetical protein
LKPRGVGVRRCNGGQAMDALSMTTATTHLSAGRVAPRCTAGGRAERLANWLALIALLALGIVWQ